MDAYSKDLENVLKKYFADDDEDIKQELRGLLQQTPSEYSRYSLRKGQALSVEGRYGLLVTATEDKCSSDTGPHIAAEKSDLVTMKCMLDRFTTYQKMHPSNLLVKTSTVYFLLWLKINV